MSYSNSSANRVLNVIIAVGITVMVVIPGILVVPGVPDIWYRVDASAVSKEVNYLTQDLGFAGTYSDDQLPELVIDNLPDVDQSLPRENRIRISSIGVNGKVYEDTNAERALAKGIWRTANFGTPEVKIPTIFASHRYGNPNWSSDFRDKEIFYKLDKVKKGDLVEVIWNQRLYRYHVKATEVGERISDANTKSDLILYTCNYWNSPKRIFVYAERI